MGRRVTIQGKDGSFCANVADAKKHKKGTPVDKECIKKCAADMKACNAEAGEKALKGDERKQFMSECLKK